MTAEADELYSLLVPLAGERLLVRTGVLEVGPPDGEVVPGVRAALCYDLSSARNSREHNHANVLTLGAGLIGEGLAWQIVETWLDTPWAEGRHARRVAKIDAVEQRFLGRRSAS